MAKKLSLLLILAIAVGMLGTTNASAVVIQSYHASSIAGNQFPPSYGLRLDGFYSGDANDAVMMGFNNIRIDIHDNNRMQLYGTVSVVEVAPDGTSGDNGPGIYNHTYELNVWFNQITDAGTLANVDGGNYNPSWTYWLIDDQMDNVEMVNVDNPNDYAELSSYPGADKPFRIGYGGNGKNNNLGASGWLSFLHNYNGQVYGNENGYLQSSDFLMDLEPVPEPATMVLFGIGLLGAGAARRFRQAKK